MEKVKFVEELHVNYIRQVSEDTESLEYALTEYMRMSGVYWGITSLALLGRDISKELNNVDALIEWVIQCQHDSGGFGGSEDQDAHMLYTLSALQILALLDALDRIDTEKAAQYIASLQQADGSFAGDEWGEIDTRFSYCALSALALLGKLHLVDVSLAADFVCKCKNFDGGYGAIPGAESHAGQIFCCVGALCIAGRANDIDRDLLGWWLAERQCDGGGLNGRPEKQSDVCYSWWILSSMCMLGCTHWIDTDALATFILRCQDDDNGGIADRPGNVADVFHTFFGIGGLSLLRWFDSYDEKEAEAPCSRRPIDPVFALPVDLVKKLGLKATVLPPAETNKLFEVPVVTSCISSSSSEIFSSDTG
mmetsp:Transcript_4381/g.6218  ORF Transcript_4381/g.6218 Transcript_4381/m.6218 type:complete len:365 (+) Transcript_4381:167-1261(+)|eukprot:CAMPEP_0197288742 /NCGR_PEP_ID=MMETSP0890-20130614/5909_1 /TAXON_ID=44058 ORGANISM="Aureoumbra lagunensis, Strain CCMP1510" /NCGR_SAMPLE_ID=MMETSP0890 /ASSEMBLY_ACC=CAM_ASM_000533 /LENGTH=364 /DNA_ID=CAMNT_0042759697 /DNA_START=148 /DNA_END=1242 /DNA_ORIENTATION=+